MNYKMPRIITARRAGDKLIGAMYIYPNLQCGVLGLRWSDIIENSQLYEFEKNISERYHRRFRDRTEILQMVANGTKNPVVFLQRNPSITEFHIYVRYDPEG